MSDNLKLKSQLRRVDRFRGSVNLVSSAKLFVTEPIAIIGEELVRVMFDKGYTTIYDIVTVFSFQLAVRYMTKSCPVEFTVETDCIEVKCPYLFRRKHACTRTDEVLNIVEVSLEFIRRL